MCQHHGTRILARASLGTMRNGAGQSAQTVLERDDLRRAPADARGCLFARCITTFVPHVAIGTCADEIGDVRGSTTAQ